MPLHPSDPGLLDTAWRWLGEHTALLVWVGVGSIGSLVLVAALLPVVVGNLAPDHFLHTRRELTARGGLYHWALRVLKNGFGALCLAAGFLMLFLPGQGLLTILVGLLLVEFPGKRALERRVVRRPAIRGFLDKVRARRGKPPLLLD